jgi:hypothetical protein
MEAKPKKLSDDMRTRKKRNLYDKMSTVQILEDADWLIPCPYVHLYTGRFVRIITVSMCTNTRNCNSSQHSKLVIFVLLQREGTIKCCFVINHAVRINRFDVTTPLNQTT